MNRNENAIKISLGFLRKIDQSSSHEEREDVIFSLVKTHPEDASRILIELWLHTMWRSSKISILKALGTTKDSRAVEFLLKVAAHLEDTTMASEAILALGVSFQPIAGEYLLSILNNKDHPLRKEAIIALTDMERFPCEKKLMQILDDEKSSDTLKQYSIIALGRRAYHPALSYIERILHDDAHSPQILNAAMAASGKIGNAQTIKILRSMNTRYRFFAHQLKQNAIERIKLRLDKSIEDAFSQITESQDEDSKIQSLNFLKEFPSEESWEAFELFSDNIDSNIACLIRSYITNENHISSNLQFLYKNVSKIKPQYTASLVRNLKAKGCPEAISLIEKNIETKYVIQILEQVREVSANKFLDKYNAAEEDKETTISIINAYVAQAYMWGKGSGPWEVMAKSILDLYRKSQILEIKERALRALGQINYDEKSFIIELGQLLKNGELSYQSIYHTLGSFDVPEATKVITKRIKNIAKKKDHTDELKLAIKTLTHFTEIESCDDLYQLPEEIKVELRIQLLNILSKTTIANMSPLINESLKSYNFQESILAITASKLNADEKSWELLFKLLDHKDSSIYIRALDTICEVGSARNHRDLLEWLISQTHREDVVRKALSSLTPREGQSYDQVLKVLNSLIKSKPGVLKQKEIETLAVNLAENLQLLKHGHSTALSQNITTKLEHDLDEQLKTKLPSYNNYSSIVKAVLRNAELTWHHTDLFNDLVDKSTMVIEYTKSLELLMQESFGKHLFLKPNSNLLRKLQTQIIHLDLNDPSIPITQRLKELKCADEFNLDGFPNHKLLGICDSFLSGKIMYNQYRVLDGLRSWALILLIFGRSFSYKNTQIEPLIPLRDSSARKINKIAANMDSLQNLRNQAAHGGTLLDIDGVSRIREYSFQILNDLSTILP